MFFKVASRKLKIIMWPTLHFHWTEPDEREERKRKQSIKE